MREERTFCRICTGHCGLLLAIDEDGAPVSARGDREDPRSLGYICSKGVTSVQAHTDGSRLLHPLKRQPDGSFVQIDLDQALDEIAARMEAIARKNGPDAIAGYRGTGGFFTTSGLGMLPALLDAFGSHKLYTTLTIDQSAKVVTAYRLGIWPPGKQSFQSADVAMMIGGNPMVSMAQLDTRNPVKRMAEAKARGLKLIVIDPRQTETAALADLFLQPLPGHDAAIVAALIHIVLEEGWHDAAFCADHVGDLDELQAAVASFAPDQVARAAQIVEADLRAAARMFARTGTRGIAVTGTGVDMGPHSNLAEHLVESLNVICGRFVRDGELVENPGLVLNAGPKPAQVVNLPRPWESGPQSRIGDYGLVGGEMVTAMLADDILRPGPGRVRALINHGGNPALAVPDQRKMVEALRDLDLLISIEPVLSATARLSHYILPPKLQFERPDLPIYLFEPNIFPTPYTRYTPALVDPPAGSDVCDEWKVFWEIARRTGRSMAYMGTALAMDGRPEEDHLIALTLANAPVSLDEVKRHPLGYYHPNLQYALPPDPATAGRFATMPRDVAAEMKALVRDWQTPTDEGFPFHFINRRARHRMNSMGATLPDLIKAMPHNPVHMCPEDMARLEIISGDWVEIASAHGTVTGLAQADGTLRPSVVSMSHGFGGLPDEDMDDAGSPNLLISTDSDLQTINAMPRMTAIPVRVRRLDRFSTPIGKSEDQAA
ncbi:molybdopterin-dependent oxidoreductase [Sphingobium sp. CFD-1]|uniref:molybdopterin-containing oxidoreductase family protein n=1 Tax=Sphingobium sp. CFD-1 TaxID=2878545 RepID=UPI00214BA75B|nr:molybdopterin-dependent oxidoreductase [Sphingobium sp. CFD-1]